MTCITEDCFNPVENHDTGLCASCGKALRKAERDSQKAEQKKAAKKPVKKVSDKMAEALVIYSRNRKEFLKENPKCVVYPNRQATQVHHGKGRATIELLLDERFWRPVSMEGHEYIHAHPEEAMRMGWSFSRLATQEPHKI